MTAVRRLSLVPTDGEATAAPERPAGAVRVAIATNDMKSLNAHFGSANRFAVYDVSKDGWTFVEALAFDDVTEQSGLHKTDGDDRITPKVEALAGCHLLFCLAIGGPAAAKVVRAGVHPIKKPGGGSAREVLAELQGRLSCPPPWLAQIMGVRSASLARFEEDIEAEESA